MRWRVCLSVVAGLMLAGGPLAGGGGLARDARPAPNTHDPSTIIRHGDVYWVFATGMGVRSLYSSNLVDWAAGPPVLPRMPGWVTNVVPDHRGHYWAPDIIAVSNRFLLYYSVSSWGRNRSAIGLASNPALDPAAPGFQWRDEGVVVESFATNDFNAIDPAVMRDAEGRLWLSFGSFWSGIKLVELDPATGHRRPQAPLFSLARHSAIEAPFIHQRGGHHYLFVNWDLCCRSTNSTYNLRVGRSERVTGPYRDRQGVPLERGGGTLLLGTQGEVIGPGHAGILSEGGRDWLSFHYYDGRRRGAPTLAIRRLRWDAEGWPEVTEETPATARAGQ